MTHMPVYCRDFQTVIMLLLSVAYLIGVWARVVHMRENRLKRTPQSWWHQSDIFLSRRCLVVLVAFS